MQWLYKGIPLKDYLLHIIKEKSDAKYLYSTVRRILSKEYSEGINLDILINDVLSRNKIKKIIAGDYKKQEKQAWNYQGIPLKKYLCSIVKNKDDLKFLYDSIKVILEREYTSGTQLDMLIEDILNRERIKSIINGEYTKSIEEKWEYKGISLTEYVDLYIKSEYRSTRQIRQNIEDYVTAKIKRENLSTRAREAIISEYIETPRFKKFLATPPKRKLSYFYNGEKLYHYLKRNVADKNNLNYIYCLIINRVHKILNLDDNKDLETVVNYVMASDEIIDLINAKHIKKIEREQWPYQNGLLIDYLKSIDLNGKRIVTVYLQVKGYINRRFPNGFITLEEKRVAVETYIDSESFANYIKYGYTNKTYYYKGMLLINYIKLYYIELLEINLKTPDDLYSKILSIISRCENIETLTLEEIEQLIDSILKSDEIRTYLNKKKTTPEFWNYNDRNLKDVIVEKYCTVIENDFDLYRIYSFITRNARKLKLENPEKNNNDIIGTFLTEDYVKNFITEYARKKEIRAELKRKTILYDNREDIDYIRLYALDNNLDINEIIEISKQGFNFYSSIIILEYSLKFDVSVKSLIDFTLNSDMSSDNYLLWLFKLGFRDYISDVIEKNKKLINLWIYRSIISVFHEMTNINYEDIYSFLNELLISKHIGITVSINNLFFSFRSFIQSCIKRCLLEIKHKNSQFKNMESLDDEDFYIQLSSGDNMEDNYIETEEAYIINDAINSLDKLEQEFIDLKYGFSGKQHSLIEIKKIWESKGIFISLEELQQIDIDVLSKLRNNPNILNLERRL